MGYSRIPLVVKILTGAVLGAVVGGMLGARAGVLKPVADLVLQLLTLLATPLIFLGVFHAGLTAEVRGRRAGRLAWLLLSNSFAAAVIGLVVADILQPGNHIADLPDRPSPPGGLPAERGPVAELLARVPHDLVSPFVNNDPVGVILIALAFGLALRAATGKASSAEPRPSQVAAYARGFFDAILQLLRWVFELIPFAVLAVVAGVVGRAGVAPFGQMLWFAGAVLLALAMTAGFYVLRLRLGGVRPMMFVRGASDALLLAFSTASSAATLPVTYACATERLGVSEENAALGVMAGGPLNHDGGALYQVVSALCVAQLIGQPIGSAGQVALVGIAVIASVCTAGIPQAGLVSMVAVFHALHLPTEWIPFLLPLDWILDRARTAINVAGNLVATCLLARK